MSFFYGKSKPPTNPPVVSSAPSVSPGTGTVNQTQYNAVDGTADAPLVDARWILNGGETPVTQNAVVPNQAGNLQRRNIFRNAAGDTVSYSNVVEVKPSVSFTPPESQTITSSAPDQCTYTLYCSEPATWTWTRNGGPGTASIASGGRAGYITFTITAGGVGSGKFDRSCEFTVHGVSDSGVVRDYLVALTATGNQ